MSEAELQRAVLELAAALGYLCYHPIPARTEKGWSTAAQGNGAAGFPDLVLVGHGRVVFAELKSGSGRLRPEQLGWRDSILANGGEWVLWNPTDWMAGTVERSLRREG